MADLKLLARLAGACLIGAVAVGLPLHPAAAQINPFRNYNGPVLSKADITAGREAAARLLDAPSPQDGMAETWTSPSSGNSGILTIERIYQQNGNDCRAVRSLVQYRNGRERNLLLQTCKVGGRWRLTS
jgi:hypothetical protein